jgi:hypothetical protein
VIGNSCLILKINHQYQSMHCVGRVFQEELAPSKSRRVSFTNPATTPGLCRGRSRAERHFVEVLQLREKVEAAAIREGRTVAVSIAVEANAPDTAARQADLVNGKAAVGEIRDHDDIVARAACVPVVIDFTLSWLAM